MLEVGSGPGHGHQACQAYRTPPNWRQHLFWQIEADKIMRNDAESITSVWVLQVKMELLNAAFWKSSKTPWILHSVHA